MSDAKKRYRQPLKTSIRVAPGNKPYVSSPEEKIHVKTKYITFVEDTFGTYYDRRGKPTTIKRFTWRNQNNIEAQVITYGARVTSIKIPDRSGCESDVVLGCDDLAGYLFHDDLHLGATIGRTTNAIEGATFVADGKQYCLMPDDHGTHINGGRRGFDKVVWVPYVNENQLILSHVSRDGDQGYSGDLYVRIFFELTTNNEFKINIQANCSKVTPVDITNMIYFNLSGHEKGEAELRKHLLLLNANCYTPYHDKGYPTGEILNVVYTRFDFQTPKVLNEVLSSGEGYDQNFCVNKGVDQGEAFVARLTHPLTGRVLEIYSNQRGVNLYTCNEFGTGLLDIQFPNFNMLSVTSETVEANCGIFLLIKKLQEYCSDVLNMPETEYLEILKTLTKKLLEVGSDDSSLKLGSHCSFSQDFNADFDMSILLLPFEMQVLTAMVEAIPQISYDMDWLQIRDIIDGIVRRNGGFDEDVHDDNSNSTDQAFKDSIYKLMTEDTLQQVESSSGDINSKVKQPENSSILKQPENNSKAKGVFPKPSNRIPKIYKDGRIHGKGGVIYKQYGGVSLRTQNYPNSMYHKNFPSAILRPHQTYSHTVTYKFWIQTGNPKKWLARMNIEENKN